MLRFLTLVLLTAIVARAETPDKPMDLLNGHDLAGWEFITTPAMDLATVAHYNPDGSLSLAGSPLGFIATKASYDNYVLHAEWRWNGKAGNSGVLLHISSGPKDRVWPVCLQVQMKNLSVGDLIPMAGATFSEKLSSEPGAKTPIRVRNGGTDSELPVGQWNVAEISCRNGSVSVKINGVVQNSVTHVSPASGRIGFQFEGTPFELRNVRVAPIKHAIAY